MLSARSCNDRQCVVRSCAILTYLGHDLVLVDELNAARLKVVSKTLEICVAVELGTEGQSSCPCEDGGDAADNRKSNTMQPDTPKCNARVRAGLFSLLVEAVVAGDLNRESA